MIRLGGLAFEVVPADALSPAERRSLARLPPDEPRRATGPAVAPGVSQSASPGPASGVEDAASGAASFVLELRDGPLTPGEDTLALDDAPAAVDWARHRVTVRHRRLEAELDPAAGTGWLRRDPSVGWPLEVTLRTALAARLPLEGGLPLHAAGLVVEGRGLVFFGPSGAGKSTLAAASPHPVLSDEMVAIVPRRPDGYELTGTGFWGTFDGSEAGADGFPLACVVELGRGPRARLDPIDSRTALRRLVAATLVPPGPPLWSAALGAIGRLVSEVPTFCLAWSPEEPWAAIERALRDGGALGPLGRAPAHAR